MFTINCYGFDEFNEYVGFWGNAENVWRELTDKQKSIANDLIHGGNFNSIADVNDFIAFELPDYFDDQEAEESVDLEEAKSNDPTKLESELETLKADYNDFGPEGFYSVPFASFERQFPEFTKTCVRAFLKELEIMDSTELKDPDLLEQYWHTGDLITKQDWECLFDGAEQLFTNRKDKGLQWEKIWRKYYNVFDKVD